MYNFNTTIRSLIIDMDGVLWHGDIPQPGLFEFFQILRTTGISFVLATNNASHTAEQYQNKLAKMGIKVAQNEILTSAMVTCAYVALHNPPSSTRIFAIGEAGLQQPLRDYGFTLTGYYQEERSSHADIVVCGKDQTLTWDKLATATLNIRAGAQFFGTNGDMTLPTELGVIHGNGAILAALEKATGVTPRIIGKPEPYMYQEALKILNSKPEHTIAIGDRLETDILGAVNAGLKSILVLSGISTMDDLNQVSYAPTWIMPNIQAITQALKNNIEEP
ncbi:MAG: HAD-IIA family hydrolase [Methylococcaceae bacterium]|jgi:4-nitrophenyl phosphatase